MTAKTLAERSASYRQRKAERVARQQEALKVISVYVARAFAGDIGALVALDAIDDVAKDALGK